MWYPFASQKMKKNLNIWKANIFYWSERKVERKKKQRLREGEREQQKQTFFVGMGLVIASMGLMTDR